MLKRMTAGFLVFLLLIGNPDFCFGNAAAANSISEIIPEKIGHVDEVYFPQPAPAAVKIIYLIQDAHASLEVQQNIAKILHHLITTRGLRTVYEEGFDGEVPTPKYFGALPFSEVRKKVGDYLIDHLEMGGAEYLHLQDPAQFRLVGVDPEKLHEQNIQWYGRSASFRPMIAGQLQEILSRLNNLIAKRFPGEIKDWLVQRDQYLKGQMDPAAYLKSLRKSKIVSRLLTKGDYPHLQLVFRSLDNPQESKLSGDFSAREFSAEIQALEDTWTEQALDKGNQNLFLLYRKIEMLTRLNALKVTFDEFQKLRDKPWKGLSRQAALLISELENKTVVLPALWEDELQAAVRFYETAFARDEAVRGNLEKDFKSGSAALVFGGFHTNRLKQILRDLGTAYYVMTPAMNGADSVHEKLYEKLMSQDTASIHQGPVPKSKTDQSLARWRSIYTRLQPLSLDQARAEVGNVVTRAAGPRAAGLVFDTPVGLDAHRSELRVIPKDPRVLVRIETKDSVSKLDRILLRNSAGKLYVHFRIKNEEDRVALENLVKIDNTKGTLSREDGLLLQVIKQGGVLFLDATGADPKKLEPFNSLFDDLPFYGTRKNRAHLELQVFVAVPSEEFENYANTVYSRSLVVDETELELSQPQQDVFDHKKDTILKEDANLKDTEVVDLKKMSNYEEVLVERISLQGGKWHHAEGALVKAVRAGKKRLVLQGPRDDSDFRYFLDQILIKRVIWVNGERFEIPTDFDIEFQEKDYSKINPSKKIYPPGTLSSKEDFTWLIHKGNTTHLLRQTSVNSNKHQLEERPGLLETAKRIRIIEDLDDDGWWHAIMNSQIERVEVALRVNVPDEYADRVAWDEAHETAEAMPVIESSELPEFKSGTATLLGSEDLALLREKIKAKMGANQTVVLDDLSSGTWKNHLSDDWILSGIASSTDFAFEVVKQRMLRELEAGKTVVLEGIHRNPKLLQEFSTLWAPVPYLIVNGEAILLSQFKGSLILVAAATPDTAPSQSEYHFVEQESSKSKAEYWTILKKEFPGLGEDKYNQLWRLLEGLKNFPAAEKRGVSGKSYPAKLSVSLSRLRVFSKLLGAFDGNAFEAFTHTWAVHFRKEPELRGWMEVRAKIAFGQQEARREKNQKIAGKRLDRLLNTVRSMDDWPSIYWQIVNTLGLASLDSLSRELSAQSVDAEEKNSKPFEIIKMALLKRAIQEDRSPSRHRESFIREILDQGSDRVDPKTPDIDSAFELDRFNAKERLALTTKIAKAVGIILLQGQPGTGKSFMLPELASQLGYEGDQVLGPFTTGSTVTQEDLRRKGHPAAPWFEFDKPAILLWDEANTADNSDFHFFVKEGVSPIRTIVMTGNDEDTEDRRPVNLVLEEGVTIAFDPFDLAFLQSEAETALQHQSFQDETDAEATARVVTRLHEIFDRAGPQYEFSIRDVQESVNRLIAFKVNAQDTAQIIFRTWLVYRDRFDAIEQQALSQVILSEFSVDVAVLEYERLEKIKAKYQNDPNFMGISLVGETLAYMAHLEDLLEIREGRMAGKFLRAGKVSSLVLGPSGWGKDAVLERLLKSRGLVDGFDSANSSKPGSQKFYLINGSMDNLALKEAVARAKKEGALLALREMNFLRSGILEGELNDLLAGGIHANSGFFFCGTLNGAHFTGRNRISSPLMSRSFVFSARAYSNESLLKIAQDYAKEKNLQTDQAESLARFQMWIALKVKNDEFKPTTRELKRAIDYLAKNPGKKWQAAARVVYGAVYERWQLKSEDFNKIYKAGVTDQDIKTATDPSLLKQYQKIAEMLLPASVGKVSVSVNPKTRDSYFDHKNKMIVISTADITKGRGVQKLLNLVGMVSFTRDEFFKSTQKSSERTNEALSELLFGEAKDLKGFGTRLVVGVQTAWVDYLMSQTFHRGATAKASIEAQAIAEMIRNKDTDGFYEQITSEKNPLTARKIFFYTMSAFLYGAISADQVQAFHKELATKGSQNNDFQIASLLEADPFAVLIRHLQGTSHPEGIETPNEWERLKAAYSRQNRPGDVLRLSEVQVQFAQWEVAVWIESFRKDYEDLPLTEADGASPSAQEPSGGKESRGPSLDAAVQSAQKQTAEQIQEKLREIKRRNFDEAVKGIDQELSKIEQHLDLVWKARVTEARLREIKDQLENKNRKLPGAVKRWLEELKQKFPAPEKDQDEKIKAISQKIEDLLKKLSEAEKKIKDQRKAAADFLEAVKKAGLDLSELQGSGLRNEGKTDRGDEPPIDVQYGDAKRDDWTVEGGGAQRVEVNPEDLVKIPVEGVSVVALTAKVEPLKENPRFKKIRKEYPQIFTRLYRSFFDWLTDSGDVMGGDVIQPSVLARTGSIEMARRTRGAVARQISRELVITGGGKLNELQIDLFRFLLEQRHRVYVLVTPSQCTRALQSVEQLQAALSQTSENQPVIDRAAVERHLRGLGLKRPWLAALSEVQLKLEAAYPEGIMRLVHAKKKLDIEPDPKKIKNQDAVMDFKAQVAAAKKFLTDRKINESSLVVDTGKKILSLNLNDESSIRDQDLEHLKGLTNLTELYLGGTKVSNAGLEHLKGLRNLTVLWLNDTQVSDAGLAHLKGLTNLTWLNFYETQVSDAAIYEFIAGHPKRDSIQVWNAKSENKTVANVPKEILAKYSAPDSVMDFKAQVAAAKKFLNDRNLRESLLEADESNETLTLSLSGKSSIHDQDLVHLKGLRNLTGLYLGGTQVSDAGLEHLKGLRNLTMLGLSGTQVSDVGIVHLKGLTNVTHLDFIGTQVSDAAIYEFIAGHPKRDSIEVWNAKDVRTTVANVPQEILDKYPAPDSVMDFKAQVAAAKKFLKDRKINEISLVVDERNETLDLNLNYKSSINDQDLVHLKGLTNLTGLYLGYTQVSNAGLEHLKGLTNLTKLWLSGTKVSNAGLEHLKGLTNLRWLNFYEAKVSDAAIYEFIAGHPKRDSIVVLNAKSKKTTVANVPADILAKYPREALKNAETVSAALETDQDIQEFIQFLNSQLISAQTAWQQAERKLGAEGLGAFVRAFKKTYLPHAETGFSGEVRSELRLHKQVFHQMADLSKAQAIFVVDRKVLAALSRDQVKEYETLFAQNSKLKLWILPAGESAVSNQESELKNKLGDARWQLLSDTAAVLKGAWTGGRLLLIGSPDRQAFYQPILEQVHSSNQGKKTSLVKLKYESVEDRGLLAWALVLPIQELAGRGDGFLGLSDLARSLSWNALFVRAFASSA
ncbi:MAG: hypothetical protein EXS63_04440 [Candidatus Omnitrophica bacterium]|nr:hypothetical protein [Candidatus Omnitrophota bacterium]